MIQNLISKVIGCILFISLTFAQFEDDIDKAIEFIQSREDLITEKILEYEIDEKLALSIIFPELIRYSYLRDYMENISNEIFYVNLGENYSNFSVGYLQMKPSFAEKIETHIVENENLEKYKELFIYKNSTSLKDKRNQRLQRLRRFEWQLNYLCVFIDIINDLHPTIHLENENDLVKFYANCYNSGIWGDKDLNIKLKDIKSFPYGDLGGRINTHSYAEFTLLFFNDLYQNIKK